MNTTELIELLKKVEKGASGRSRDINLRVDGNFISNPDIEVSGTGDGVAGAMLYLNISSNLLQENNRIENLHKDDTDLPSIKMMIGIPRCGKTTYSNRIKKDNDVIVSADTLRLLIHGKRYLKNREKEVWGAREHILKMLMIQSMNIIIDETNTAKFRRENIFKLAKDYGYRVYGYYFQTDYHTCIDRAIRGNGESGSERWDLVPVIKDKYEKFEPPEIEEGFLEITKIKGENNCEL